MEQPAWTVAKGITNAEWQRAVYAGDVYAFSELLLVACQTIEELRVELARTQQEMHTLIPKDDGK